MSDLFWIIPSIMLGFALVLISAILTDMFKNSEPEDIAFDALILLILGLIVSLSIWLTGQKSQGMQVAGFLIFVLAGLVFAFIFFEFND